MEHQSRKQVVLPGDKWTTEKGQEVWHTFDEVGVFFPAHKSCQNKLPIGCYTRLLHAQQSPCLLLCREWKFSEKLPQTGINLEGINQHLVSHMTTDLPHSNIERLRLMPWTLLLIWGQQIQELVKPLKDFKSFLILHQGNTKTPDIKGETCMRCKQCELSSCSEPPSRPWVPAVCCLFRGGLHLSHGRD